MNVDTSREIVDAQVHIWGADAPERPWPPRDPSNPIHREVAFSLEDLVSAMDGAGVQRAIIVPPGWEGNRNDLALEAARLYPKRFGIMGRIAMNDPASASQLTDWRAQPGMLGLRLTFQVPVWRSWLQDGHADWLWPVAERNGLPLMIHAPHDLPLVGTLAEKYPGLRFVIDHLGIAPGMRDEQAFEHLETLIGLARLPNIAVKATALPCYSTQPYPYTNLHVPLRRVFDAFGPKRLFWGSDLTRLKGSYADSVRLFIEELRWMESADLDYVMGRGLREWLGWDTT